MVKIKRNEPCPCGSGKKYKKCCGVQGITDFSPDTINHELVRLHHAFTSFATNRHKDQIDKIIASFTSEAMHSHKETKDVYHIGLILWILLNAPVQNHNKTILEVFYDEHAATIKPQVRHTFASWAYHSPSVYEVLSREEATNVLSIQDLQDNQHYKIPINKDDQYKEGNLIVGTLVPYAEHYNFLYSVIKLYAYDKQRIVESLKHYAEKDQGLQKYFPAFLEDVLLLEPDFNKDPLKEKVTQLFANHLVEKNIDDETILKGITIWNTFCERENPQFKKSEGYAAALEYYVQTTILNNSDITQSQIAREYQARPGTVSAHYRKLRSAVGVLNEP